MKWMSLQLRSLQGKDTEMGAEPESERREGQDSLTGSAGRPSPLQSLHGAQGCQLHKGVRSDFVDSVVLETTGKAETGLRTS